MRIVEWALAEPTVTVAVVPIRQLDERAMALMTEQRLVAATRLLGDLEAAGEGKALLVHPTAAVLPARARVSLQPVLSGQDWRDYENQRVVVEAGFGVDAVRALAMVEALRERSRRLGLVLYLASDAEQVVGAVGCFRLPPPHRQWARLQEVDVFPSWRGRGYGDALLAAVLELLVTGGSDTVVVGADEDDWPLTWYRRRGFRDVARVPLTR